MYSKIFSRIWWTDKGIYYWIFDLDFRIIDGEVTYYINGTLQATSSNTITSFPVYFHAALQTGVDVTMLVESGSQGVAYAQGAGNLSGDWNFNWMLNGTLTSSLMSTAIPFCSLNGLSQTSMP